MEKIRNIREKEAELWISCISYEERTLNAFLKRTEPLFKPYFKIFFLNVEVKSWIDEKTAKMLQRQNNTIIIDVNYKEPTSIIPRFYSALKNLVDTKSISNIHLDITTFTRIELLVLLSMLLEFNLNRIRIYYIAAKRYGTWLSKGFDKKVIIPFYEGEIAYTKQNLLIIIAGFDEDRVIGLIDELEPHRIILGKSVEGFEKNFDLRVDSFIKRLEFVCDNYEIHEISAADVEIAMNQLTSIVEKYKDDYNIHLCPSGTKLQTLACFLLHLKYPQIQFVYSIPLNYNIQDYSKGAGKMYVYDLEINASK